MGEPTIHKTAIVASEAKIGANVSIGAYSIIGPHVEIGENCVIHSHVVIEGHTKIGNNNEFYQFSAIGFPPQDLTYKGEPTKVVIGNNNIFREYVSVHRGTLKEEGITTIGDNCFFMAHVHLAHDTAVGNNCVFANSVNLAGHVKIAERVIIGGGTQISQFCSLGRGAYIGGGTVIDRDIPLFCTAVGNRARLKGINIIGMRRQGFDKSVVSEVVDFFRMMEASALAPRAFVDHEELMEEFKGNEVIDEMAASIRDSEIGVAPFMS